MIHLEKENFNELIKKKTIVDFYATWCGPCKMLSPIFEELDKEINSFHFVKVDVDCHEELCREYKVMSIPTIIIFDDGVELERNVGFIPKEKLKEKIEKYNKTKE